MSIYYILDNIIIFYYDIMKSHQNPFNLLTSKLKKLKNVNNFKHLFNPKNNLELMLFVIFIIYIVFNVNTPNFLVPLINNNLAFILIIIVAFYILMNCNPILGVLAFIVAYTIIKRSSFSSPNYIMNNYIPSEKNKEDDLIRYNSNPNPSLEEEIVSKMPILDTNINVAHDNSVQPILDSSIDSNDI